MNRPLAVVGIVVVVAAAAGGAFIAGRDTAPRSPIARSEATTSHAVTTTTTTAVPSQPVSSSTVTVVKCPTSTTIGISGFEPTTLVVHCPEIAGGIQVNLDAVVTLSHIVWTTWGSNKATGAGTLRYFTTETTKTDCTQHCGTEISGQFTTTKSLDYCPGHRGTPTFEWSPGTQSPFCGLTTAPTTACGFSTENATQCPPRNPVYAPVGRRSSCAAVTLSNPLRQNGSLVWGSIVAAALEYCTGGLRTITRTFRAELPTWGLP